MIPAGHLRHCLTGQACTCKGVRTISEEDRMAYRIEVFARRARQAPSRGRGLRWFRAASKHRRAS